MWRVATLIANRRRELPWEAIRVSASCLIPIGTALLFVTRYADVFGGNYIAELFCQLAWVQDYVDSTAIELPVAEPPFVVPDVLIHCTTARAVGLALQPLAAGTGNCGCSWLVGRLGW